MSSGDDPRSLERTIDTYNDAWNGHDLDAIASMHAPDMVFENHTAGERAVGDAVREHIGQIFETWPDTDRTFPPVPTATIPDRIGSPDRANGRLRAPVLVGRRAPSIAGAAEA